jgi:hypothetical protein
VLVVAVCALVLLSPLLVGRWPAGLLLHRWRLPLLVWATLALQVVSLEVPMPAGVAPVLHIATYGVALTFLVLNRRAPGLLVVAAGAAANGITIALNGGTLPASASAVAAAGHGTSDDFENSGVLTDPVLPWLGDVFAWPAPLPLANTFSVGDILIVAGVAVAAWTGTARWGRLATPRPADERAELTEESDRTSSPPL